MHRVNPTLFLGASNESIPPLLEVDSSSFSSIPPWKSHTIPSSRPARLRHARMGRVSKKRHADAPSDEEVAQPSKKTKTKTAAEPGKDDEGNSFWPLSATRRVVIQNFKGKNYVNFREYYSDASGELKPTKKVSIIHYDINFGGPCGVLKPGALATLLPDEATERGIMLTLEQYNDLLTAIPALNAELQSKGHDVPDIFVTSSNTSAPKRVTKSPPKDQSRKKKKMNIEATSDEEEAESD
ncbi:hypothetical protein RRF57_004555 [Xylaria bambusicola]|uniref:Transcriptional coactivator p15 (PC4) C-terminal domain-containing protein n=1 Tax=Xylaria bambusicola TaxID=326684 RepID=A0AAN7UAU2_9PEZI